MRVCREMELGIWMWTGVQREVKRRMRSCDCRRWGDWVERGYEVVGVARRCAVVVADSGRREEVVVGVEVRGWR
jgi:hypothetical protein